MSPVRIDAGIGRTTEAAPRAAGPNRSENRPSFAGELQAQMRKHEDVRISAHAQKRLAQRNVELGDSERARLSEAVDKVSMKGADRSLVLMDDLALLVSARNRTVITALDSNSAKDGVFTNIDSAVII